MADVEVAKIEWPCARCGAKADQKELAKYEVVVSRLPGQEKPEGPIGSFQRHFCDDCAKRVDDILMAAIDKEKFWFQGPVPLHLL